MVTSGSYWLGGSDTAVDGKFVWESGNAIIFENWDPGEPSNVTNILDCVLLMPDWTWHDYNCNSKFPSICEKDLSNTGNDRNVNILAIGQYTAIYTAVDN